MRHPVKILQFGEGVFLRAFIDWMVEEMNEKAGFAGSVAVVKPRPGPFAPAYARQGLSYTVVLRGLLSGRRIEERRRIGAVSRLVHPYEDFEAFLREAENPDLACVVSNTTESGIAPSPSDRAEDRPAASFPGKLAQLLRRRYEAFGGDPKKGLVILPCELVEDNAAVLRGLVLGHAARWYADPAFDSWLKESNVWVDSLVDRIVTGHSAEERAALLAAEGFDDELLVVAEPYHFLALRGDPGLEALLPFGKAGLNVVWAADIAPYRELKVRLLNGSHTLMALLGLPRGRATVRECLSDGLLMEALRRYQAEETIPTLPLPRADCEAFLESVLERFSNPYLEHRLAGIASKSVAKYASRILPSLRAGLAAGRPAPRLASFLLAALAWRCAWGEGLEDEAAALAWFASRRSLFEAEPLAAMRELLGAAGPWGEAAALGLGREEAAAAAAESLADIRGLGLEGALRRLLGRAGRGEADPAAACGAMGGGSGPVAATNAAGTAGQEPAAVHEDDGAQPFLLLRLDPRDTVAVAAADIPAGALAAVAGEAPLRALEALPRGHKLALRAHAEGEAVVKYGRPIGRATRAIAEGEWVHTRNLESRIKGEIDYGGPPEGLGAQGNVAPDLARGAAGTAGGASEAARPAALPAGAAGPTSPAGAAGAAATFRGYRRADGSVGVRNQLWILPTVGCVNGVAERLAAWARAELGADALALCHPYGCSQLGDDLSATRRLLAALARHPNAGGVLVLGLGCENNGLEDFLAEVGPRPAGSLEALRLQDEGDEIAAGKAALGRLAARAAKARRESLPLSELVLGLKCGGSDAFSGITANPIAGRLADLVVSGGGSALLSEVPEMFGAEEELLSRAATAETWKALAAMVNEWKAYYLAHGQGSHENPSPGNRDGGITTIEEKSLGCVRKAGSSPVRDVLPYGGRRRVPGLSLVSGPGNDLVSSTALAAAGAQLIVFTTGRGTPFGSVVPTLKVSTNSELAARKPGWIDWDAGRLLSGAEPEALAGELLGLVLRVAGGEPTRNELSGCSEIAIFKDGVTL